MKSEAMEGRRQKGLALRSRRRRRKKKVRNAPSKEMILK